MAGRSCFGSFQGFCMYAKYFLCTSAKDIFLDCVILSAVFEIIKCLLGCQSNQLVARFLTVYLHNYVIRLYLYYNKEKKKKNMP